MTLLILGIVMTVVGNFVVDSARSVATSTTSFNANEEAQQAFDQLDSTLRFACQASVSSDGSTLFALDAPNCNQPTVSSTCYEWGLNTQNHWLTQLSTKAPSTAAVIATGVYALAFNVPPTTSRYTGLVGVSITVGTGTDPPPVTLDETVSAENMNVPIEATATPVCTP